MFSVNNTIFCCSLILFSHILIINTIHYTFPNLELGKVEIKQKNIGKKMKKNCCGGVKNRGKGRVWWYLSLYDERLMKFLPNFSFCLLLHHVSPHLSADYKIIKITTVSLTNPKPQTSEPKQCPFLHTSKSNTILLRRKTSRTMEYEQIRALLRNPESHSERNQ